MPTRLDGLEPHGYCLALADGREVIIDISTADDWGNVQECYDGDRKFPGWGDADEHVEIVDVYDCETESHLDPLAWAEGDVWLLAAYFAG